MSAISPGDLETIARFSDPDGVLSCYFTVDPGQDAMGGRPQETKLFEGVDTVLSALRDRGDQTRQISLEPLLTTLLPRLREMVNPATPGRGRALFVGVASGEVRSVTTQVLLGDHVVLDQSPYLRPLVVAYSVAGPAGMVAVTAQSVRVLEERLGIVTTVAGLHYEPPADEDGAGNDRDERDDYRRRLRTHRERFLADAGAKVGRVAERSGWEHLVVTGDPGPTIAFAAGVVGPARKRMVAVHHTVPEGLSPGRIARLVAGELVAARRAHQEALVGAAIDAPPGRGPAVRGLSDTLALLGEGRVRHLLMDESAQWRGHRDGRGRLWADPERPVGAGVLKAEPDLAERMIELGFRTGARVTLLDPVTAAPLSGSDGVAALLRW